MIAWIAEGAARAARPQCDLRLPERGLRAGLRVKSGARGQLRRLALFRQPLCEPRGVGVAKRRMERPAIVKVAIVVRTSIDRVDERLEG